MSAPKLAVFVAFKDELRRLKNQMTDEDIITSKKIRGYLGGVLVDLIQTDIGPEAAQKSAVQILNDLPYRGCIVYGYCGGLSPRLHVNDVVIAEQVLGEGAPIKMDQKLNDQLGKILVAEGITYKNVPLITQDTIIEKQIQRLDLFKKTKAEAVDMEAYEIVKQARLKNIPVFVLKTVVDDIHIDLPNLQPYFKSKKITAKEVTQALEKNSGESVKIFTKNIKSGGEVLQKIAPLVTSFVENYWCQQS
jgi:nucleoside phosphorylase